MKTLATALFLALLAAIPARAANLGPEVAVVQIQFPKEKLPRQVIIGLYDDSAPYTLSLIHI